jgi:hypothetical protein
MKKVLARISQLCNYLLNFRPINRFKKINATLENKLEDREVDRIILKGNIIKMVRKYLRIDARSKYIPRESRNNTEIRERVLAEFGDQMNYLGIRINDKLELV